MGEWREKKEILAFGERELHLAHGHRRMWESAKSLISNTLARWIAVSPLLAHT